MGGLIRFKTCAFFETFAVIWRFNGDKHVKLQAIFLMSFASHTQTYIRKSLLIKNSSMRSGKKFGKLGHQFLAEQTNPLRLPLRLTCWNWLTREVMFTWPRRLFFHRKNVWFNFPDGDFNEKLLGHVSIYRDAFINFLLVIEKAGHEAIRALGGQEDFSIWWLEIEKREGGMMGF